MPFPFTLGEAEKENRCRKAPEDRQFATNSRPTLGASPQDCKSGPTCASGSYRVDLQRAIKSQLTERVIDDNGIARRLDVAGCPTARPVPVHRPISQP